MLFGSSFDYSHLVPIPPGHRRHQYILTLDAATLALYTTLEEAYVIQSVFSTSNLPYVQLLADDAIHGHAYRLWLDLPFDVHPYAAKTDDGTTGAAGGLKS